MQIQSDFKLLTHHCTLLACLSCPPGTFLQVGWLGSWVMWGPVSCTCYAWSSEFTYPLKSKWFLGTFRKLFAFMRVNLRQHPSTSANHQHLSIWGRTLSISELFHVVPCPTSNRFQPSGRPRPGRLTLPAVLPRFCGFAGESRAGSAGWRWCLEPQGTSGHENIVGIAEGMYSEGELTLVDELWQVSFLLRMLDCKNRTCQMHRRHRISRPIGTQ